MNDVEKEQLKSTLYTFLIQHSGVPSRPSFVRNKIIKMLVQIMKYSWPHQYPDFFSNIMSVSWFY